MEKHYYYSKTDSLATIVGGMIRKAKALNEEVSTVLNGQRIVVTPQTSDPQAIVRKYYRDRLDSKVSEKANL